MAIAVVPTAAASGIALLVAQVHRQLRPKDSLHQRLLRALQKTFIAKQVLGLLVSLQQLIHRRGPWRGFEAVEFATLEWVDWFNNRWLLEPIGNTLPTEAESRYCAQSAELAKVA